MGIFEPFIPLQDEPTDCGYVAIEAATTILRRPVRASFLREQFGVSARGLRVSFLVDILRSQGFEATAFKYEHGVSVAGLRSISTPAIGILDRRHYVVLENIGTTRCRTFDPAFGWQMHSLDDIAKRFQSLFVEVGLRDDQAKLPTLSYGNELGAWIAKSFTNRDVLPIVLLGLITQCVALGIPLLTRDLFAVETSSGVGGMPISVLIGYGITAVFGTLLGVTGLLVNSRVSAGTATRIGKETLEKMMTLRAAFLNRNSPERVCRRLGITEGLQSFVLKSCTGGIVSCVSLFLAIYFAASISPALVVLALLSVAFAIPVESVFHRKTRSNAEARFHASNEHKSILLDTIKGIHSIRLFRVQGAAHERVCDRLEHKIRLSVEDEKLRATRKVITDSITVIDRLVYMVLGSYFLGRGGINFGEFVSVGLFRETIRSNAMSLLSLSREMRLNCDAFAKLAPILSSCNNLDSISGFAGSESESRLMLRISDCGFRHSAFDDYVFRGLNLEICVGEFVGVCAPSGTGKSTLANVIAGVTDATEGSVAVFTNSVAYVMQSDRLIRGSVLENILLFRGYTEEDVFAAAEEAAIHDEIVAFSMGYNTFIDDDTPSISGGQRQRILLARALLSKPELLILDEATSAVDAATETRILENLRKAGGTVVMFAHRAETHRLADRVVPMFSMFSSVKDASPQSLRLVSSA